VPGNHPVAPNDPSRPRGALSGFATLGPNTYLDLQVAVAILNLHVSAQVLVDVVAVGIFPGDVESFHDPQLGDDVQEQKVVGRHHLQELLLLRHRLEALGLPHHLVHGFEGL
jgi:hypothetical protein